jgi:serine/arginine repetitive matrix protein 2
MGFDSGSFDEVRRGFEFSDDRPMFYPPSAATRHVPHRRHELTLSTVSVSSYGNVINAGSLDPFDYGLPSLRESSGRHVKHFYTNGHRRHLCIHGESTPTTTLPAFISEHHCLSNKDNLSLVDTAIEIPPHLFHHMVHPLVFITAASLLIVGTTRAPVPAPLRCLTQGTVQTVTRHRKEVSVDSVMSDFSGMHLGRPGLGDKMFNNATDLGPLTSISASPPESTSRHHVGNRSSFDSIIDYEHRSSQEDSLFKKTHYRSSMSSDSVFGDEFHFQNGLIPPNQFRPVFVHNIVCAASTVQ